ncbi:unnamed protein product [Pleuronectes platessa]|uniref:Uncharacterized protein n=1 Tax=Pleuronectes platessa TaxID=8262 RepID=A0A9N7VJG9_PLEPL|nr:unnamed protein product [Pleuronectes platessa]
MRPCHAPNTHLHTHISSIFQDSASITSSITSSITAAAYKRGVVSSLLSALPRAVPMVPSALIGYCKLWDRTPPGGCYGELCEPPRRQNETVNPPVAKGKSSCFGRSTEDGKREREPKQTKRSALEVGKKRSDAQSTALCEQ